MSGPRKECVLCGRCLEVCPLFLATGREELSPRAKFALEMLGPGGGLDPKTCAKLAGLCLACGRCEGVCPQKLSGPDLVAALREAHPGFEQWMWGQWMSRSQALWPMAAALSKLAGVLPGRKMEGLAGRLAGLASDKPLAPWVRPVRLDPCGRGRKAVIFPGCVAASARPGWTATAARLLSGLGFEVSPDPGFGCCGSSLAGAGLSKAAAEQRRANAEAWRKAGKPLLAVFCATCLGGLGKYAAADSGFHPGEAEEWTRGLVPLSALLGTSAFEAVGPVPARVWHHRPCHAAKADPDLALVRRFGPVERASSDRCCGFGGVMQLGAPDLSAAVAGRCWEYFGTPAAAGRTVLVTGCSGCALQLAATAPAGVEVGHWLEAVGE